MAWAASPMRPCTGRAAADPATGLRIEGENFALNGFGHLCHRIRLRRSDDPRRRITGRRPPVHAQPRARARSRAAAVGRHAGRRVVSRPALRRLGQARYPDSVHGGAVFPGRCTQYELPDAVGVVRLTARLHVGDGVQAIASEPLVVSRVYHAALSYDGSTVRFFLGAPGQKSMLVGSRAASGAIRQGPNEMMPVGGRRTARPGCRRTGRLPGWWATSRLRTCN